MHVKGLAMGEYSYLGLWQYLEVHFWEIPKFHLTFMLAVTIVHKHYNLCVVTLTGGGGRKELDNQLLYKLKVQR